VAAEALSGTLTANVATTGLQLTATYPGGINIINRSGTGTIWYRLDGTAPTVAGNDCHPVLGAVHIDNPFDTGTALGAVTVKLISDAALAYTIECDPTWVRA